MNRLRLLSYLVFPVFVMGFLLALGLARLWSGFPFAWVLGCVLILSLGDGCGLVLDWSLFWLDVLFYTGLGFAVLLAYYMLLGKGKPHFHPS